MRLHDVLLHGSTAALDLCCLCLLLFNLCSKLSPVDFSPDWRDGLRATNRQKVPENGCLCGHLKERSTAGAHIAKLKDSAKANCDFSFSSEW